MTITFTPGAVIPSTWLNDLNTVAYIYFGDGVNLNSPTKLTIGHVNAGVGFGLLLGSNNVAQWNVVSAGHLLTQSGDNVLDIGASGSNRPRTGYFGTSVVTPLVQTTSNANLVLGANSRLDWAIDKTSAALLPVASVSIGSSTNIVASVFTPIIDSGTAGSLSLKVNNGETILDLLRPGAVSANRWTMQGGASGSNGVSLFPTGGDTNISAFYTSRGTGNHTFQTNIGAPVVQFQILDTVSANRNITVTGSNGGNPTLAVTAGSLAITPAVVLASTLTGPSNMLSPITNSLGADVLLNNTANYFDGPSVAQGTSGTWFVSGTVCLLNGSGTSTVSNIKLWDGTTVIASARSQFSGTAPWVIALSGFITSPAGNLRISVNDPVTTISKIIFNGSGNSKDSTITAIRIA